MKKFVEDNVEFDFSNPLSFIKAVVCMSIVAPFKLVMAITSKILYLPKRALSTVFFYSLIVAGFITLANIAYQAIFMQVRLFSGKFPIVVMIVATVVLALAYLFVSVHDFTVSVGGKGEQFVESGSVEAESKFDDEQPIVSAEQFTESDKSVVKFEESQEVSIDFSDFDIEDNRLCELDYGSGDAVVTSKVLSDEENAALLEALERSAEQSEFLSQALLARFDDRYPVEDNFKLESLKLSVIPNNFRILA